MGGTRIHRRTMGDQELREEGRRRKVDDRTRIQDPARRMGRPAGPDGRCWTFNEIAEHLGVSTERARQIERLGVLMLRHPVYGLEIKEAIAERRATA